MNDFDDIKDFLSRVNDKVKRNVEIITPDELGQDYVLHIATINFSSLIPNVSRRGAWSEDNTVTRIHTSTDLMGCIRGHAGVVDLALNSIVTSSKSEEYRGGFYIYQIPFKVALKPNTKLVYDSDYTNEVWLVPYNRETRVYKPSIVGKMVICAAKVESIESKLVTTLETAIQVPEGMKLTLDKDTHLTPGYWMVHFKQSQKKNGSSEIDFHGSRTITAGEFDNLKKERAAMLSL